MTTENPNYKPIPPREIQVTLGKGISATFAIPRAFDSKNPFQEGLPPVTHKAALILHGQGGHRNYCYQKLIAHRLAAELGIFSLRIDFRGCGESADNEDELQGRQLSQDVEDIQACAEWIMNGKLNPLGIHLTLSTVIAHSRGAVAMFLWAQKQDELVKQGNPNAIIVPNLINCASRFTSKTVLNRYMDLKGVDYLPVKMPRYGKIQQMKLAAREILSLAEPDLTQLWKLSRDWSVLSVYGTDDHIVPRYDCSNFANTLNRGRYSHELKLIPDADHNFYGVHEINTKDDMEDFNPGNLPLKGNKVNFNVLVTDYIIDYLQPANEMQRFLSISNVIGKVARWKDVEGVNNFRDIGGWRIHNPTFKLETTTTGASSKEGHVNYYVRPHLAFRCANIAGLTENGLKSLKKLGIKAIFDLRSDGEVEKDGFPQGLERYGIKRIHSPVYSKDDYSPDAIAIRYSNLMTSWSTYVHVYEDMLELGTGAYKRVFEFIRDENQPLIFHCTAGKDRTGVLGMLILLLAGIDKDMIRFLILNCCQPNSGLVGHNWGKFKQTVKKLREKYGDNNDIEVAISQGRKNWKIEEHGFENLVSSRYEAMLETINVFHEKYGNIVNYMKDKLGFSQQDIIKIYEHLVVVDPQNSGFENSTQVNWDHRNSGRAKF
ncbi:uncharacterized protein J8A68_002945 [[Candida] subhashii]|uniref:Tyrosine specific protein phosphatases domain-containing protein n=1 Tax=[Candida] subhashii TaxID=561895 RepID=A0A8J5UZK8_9ASCO|nr:uncharacterized protein J8A68_002945 [[Candida] subhashii]KAG7663559.1 hypothetical protein J8A68_002945 [[Candida] subhashii]